MSNKELTATNTGYIIPSINDEIMESAASELDGLPITLDKVKIPAGGGLSFEVPGNDPDSPDSAKEIVGVIVDHYPLNSYWPKNITVRMLPPIVTNRQPKWYRTAWWRVCKVSI